MSNAKPYSGYTELMIIFVIVLFWIIVAKTSELESLYSFFTVSVSNVEIATYSIVTIVCMLFERYCLPSIEDFLISLKDVVSSIAFK